MKKFKQFLAERENLYKITDDQLEKELDHEHDVPLSKDQVIFLKKHLPTCLKAKENTSLIATLSKSKDFNKVAHVISSKKK